MKLLNLFIIYLLLQSIQSTPLDPSLRIRGIHIGGNWGYNYQNFTAGDGVVSEDFFKFLESVHANAVGISQAIHIDDSLDDSVELVTSGKDIPSFSPTVLRKMIRAFKDRGFDVYLTLAFEDSNARVSPHPVQRWQLGDPNYPNENPSVAANWPWSLNHPLHDTFVRNFWTSYTQVAVETARLAQEEGVFLFSLGTETERLFRSRSGNGWPNNFKNELQTMVQSVKAVFHGALTYDMHSDAFGNSFYEPGSRHLWKDIGLDAIGVSAYFRLTPTSPTMPITALDANNAFGTVFDQKINPVRDENPTRPVLFLEFGYVNDVSSPFNPSSNEFQPKSGADLNSNGFDDGDETQRNIYQGFFESAGSHRDPVLGCFLWGHEAASDSQWFGGPQSPGNLKGFGMRGKLSQSTVAEFYFEWKTNPPAKRDQIISFSQPGDVIYGSDPVTLVASASSGLPVTFTLVSGPATLSSNQVFITGAGIITVAASQNGDGSYNPGNQNRSFAAVKAKLTITADDASRPYGSPNPVFEFRFSGFVGGDSSTVVAGAPALSSTGGSDASVGSYPIVVQLGTLSSLNYDYVFVNGQLTVDKANQVLDFSQPADRTYGDDPIALSATASSGLPVTFSVLAGPGNIAGNQLTIAGAGVIKVRASQSGGNDFKAAPDVDRSLSVVKAQLTVRAVDASRAFGISDPVFSVTITGLVNQDTSTVVLGTPDLNTLATSSSAPGIYPIIVQKGTLASANYTLQLVNGTLTVGKASQTISFSRLGKITYGDAPISLTATASSGLPVTLSLTSGPGSISGNQLTILAVGTVNIRASQAGDGDYEPAADVVQSFAAGKADQSISFGTLDDRDFGDVPFTLIGSASSGLPLSFSVISGPATITGDLLTPLGAGTVVTRASQPGDSNFDPAPDVEQSFRVLGGVISIKVVAEGFTIAFGGAVGRTYVLQMSNNLAAWIDLQEQTNSNGTLEFTDSTTPGVGTRFYRIRIKE